MGQSNCFLQGEGKSHSRPIYCATIIVRTMSTRTRVAPIHFLLCSLSPQDKRPEADDVSIDPLSTGLPYGSFGGKILCTGLLLFGAYYVGLLPPGSQAPAGPALGPRMPPVNHLLSRTASLASDTNLSLSFRAQRYTRPSDPATWAHRPLLLRAHPTISHGGLQVPLAF